MPVLVPDPKSLTGTALRVKSGRLAATGVVDKKSGPGPSLEAEELKAPAKVLLFGIVAGKKRGLRRRNPQSFNLSKGCKKGFKGEEEKGSK